MRSYNASCSNCGLQKICFPTGLSKDDTEKLDSIVDRGPVLHKGDYLFKSGDPFESLYAIKAGAVKVYSISASGAEHIYGFFLPGDVLGVEALSTGEHNCSAVAIDTCSVCEIPYSQLGSLSLQIPALNQQVFCLMSKATNDSRLHSEILSKKSAEQKVASFIESIASKFQSRGYLYSEFSFGALHRDVAKYLGLTPETLSRVLSKFAKEELVEWRSKEVRIFNKKQLQKISLS